MQHIPILDYNINFIHNKFGWCYYIFLKDDTVVIYNLFVHPYYRKRGHATKLINHIISEVRELGYKKDIEIEAEPTEGNISKEDLIKFYLSLGLKIREK